MRIAEIGLNAFVWPVQSIFCKRGWEMESAKATVESVFDAKAQRRRDFLNRTVIFLALALAQNPIHTLTRPAAKSNRRSVFVAGEF
jgi:hypothetical protein